MTQEEKLQEAKRLYKSANADQRYVLESLFPELAESEDEKIRKALISILKSDFEKDTTIFGISVEQIIAWLEKQGNKPQGKTYTFEGKSVLEAIDKIGEKKFREGDKVIIDGKVCTIKSINEDNYIVNDENGKDVQIHFSYVDGWKLVGELTAKEMKELLRTEYEKGRADTIAEMQKEWGEEDEKRTANILSVLSVQVCWDGATLKKMNPYQKEIDWLKSLKQRIGG